MRTTNDDSGIRLLCQCLALSHDPGELFQLRARLFGDAACWPRLTSAALTLGLMPALAVQLAAKGLLPPEPAEPATAITPGRSIREYSTALADRREEQRVALTDIVAALNARGIVPLLVKDTADVWTEATPGHYAPAIDLVLKPSAWAPACDALAGLGYRVVAPLGGRSRQRTVFSAFHNPGWVELHGDARGPTGRRWLDDAAREEHRIVSQHEGAEAALLPPYLAVAHSFLLRHDDAAGRAWPSHLRGLHELATALDGLSADDLARLHDALSGSPLMRAVIDFGIAAAAHELRLRPRAPFTIEADAAERWRRGADRPRSAGAMAGFRTRIADARMACARSRLEHGTTWAALGRARLSIVIRGLMSSLS